MVARSFLKPFAAVAALGFVVAAPNDARAFDPYLVVPDPAAAESTPAYRYANMTDAEAFAELDKRKILYSKVDHAFGVRAPIRLTGRLHGVYIHSSLPPDQRVTSMFEICDARLALALDDFSAVLEKHDIDELVHYTMYRPNAPAPEHEGMHADAGPTVPAATAVPAPGRPHASNVSGVVAAKTKALSLGKGKLDPKKPASILPAGSKQKVGELPKNGTPAVRPVTGAATVRERTPAARVATKPLHRSAIAKREAPVTPAAARPTAPAWAPPGTRHPAGLAIDVALVHKKDGRWLSVSHMFRGHIGDKTCGEGSHVADDPDAREMRDLVCEPASLGIFTYVLTPNYNQAHADHFHMEIKAGVHWFLYH